MAPKIRESKKIRENSPCFFSQIITYRGETVTRAPNLKQSNKNLLKKNIRNKKDKNKIVNKTTYLQPRKFSFGIHHDSASALPVRVRAGGQLQLRIHLTSLLPAQVGLGHEKKFFFVYLGWQSSLLRRPSLC